MVMTGKCLTKRSGFAGDQIARYFSRLSVMYRSGRQAIDQADPSAAEDGGGLCRRGRRDLNQA